MELTREVSNLCKEWIQGIRWTCQIILRSCHLFLRSTTAATGERALPALEIAKVHLFFNLLGVLLIFGIPFLRPLPMIGAERLAAAASENKLIALVYLVGVFFVIPLILLGVSLLFQWQ